MNLHISPIKTMSIRRFEDTVAEEERKYTCGTVSVEEFDKIACDFNDTCIDQIALYKTITAGGHKQLFLSYRDGGVVGGAVVVVYTLPIIGGIANIRFGPFWRRQGSPENEQDYRFIIEQLREEFCNRQGLMLTILPRPHPQNSSIEIDILKSMGFSHKDNAHHSSRYLVDTALSASDQMQSLSQKWRYNLRKSLKNRLDVKQAKSGEDLEEFKRIHENMVTRKGVSLSDILDIIPQLQNHLLSKRIATLYLAYLENEAVAGAAVIQIGDTAHYLYGASSGKALSVNASYALHWKIVGDLKKNNVLYYDLGGSSGFDGLQQFKRGLMGKQGIEVPLSEEFSCHIGMKAYLAGNIVHFLRFLKAKFLRIRNKIGL